MKILHIINGLNEGGAEQTLFKICKYDLKNTHIVVSLTNAGTYFSLIKNLNIKVYCLHSKFFSIHKFFYLIKLIRSLKPDIVQTWLVQSDLIGGTAAWLAGIKNIFWNIRYSKLEIGKAKLTTILMLKILSKLSYFIPELIIIASKKAKKTFEIENYDKKKFRFIPNGYDLSILKPDKIKKKKFRKKMNIKKQIPLIGCVARYDIQKDHLNLFKSLAIIRCKNINFSCVLIGSDIYKNKNLIYEIKKLNLNKHVKLLKSNRDISKIMNGIDIHILSSSYGEGFPNVVAEAMAFKTPCIATNVGDSSIIVGKTGWIVPPNNSIRLAKVTEKAINEIGTKRWVKRCEKARLRIKENFDMIKMIKSYNKLWYKIYIKNK